jgi:dihydrolipoamide dehydrogenase
MRPDVFGISGDVTFDFGGAWKRSRAAADRMAKGVHYLMKKNKDHRGRRLGHLHDDHTLSVKGPNGTETVTFDNVIIAAGATTRLLPGTSLSERVVTYEEQIMTDSLPESIIIAGAGAIGVEFAYVMANYGVQVTLVEFLDRIVPLEEPEVSAELAKAYKKLGVAVLAGTKVETIDDSGARVKVTVSPD